MKFCLYVWVNREQQMNSCPCWFYTVRKVNRICLLQQLYTVRGAEKEILCCWFFTQSKRTARNFFSCWSSTVRLVKLFEEHSSWWKLYWSYNFICNKGRLFARVFSFLGFLQGKFLVFIWDLIYASILLLIIHAYVLLYCCLKVYIRGKFWRNSKTLSWINMLEF